MRLIDADKLKEVLKSNCKPELCHDINTAWCDSCCRTNDFEDLIDNAPTGIHDNYSMGYQDGVRQVLKEVAEGKHRPKGKWLIEGGNTLHYVCSECGCAGDVWDKFCKHCGAKMVKENEE